LPPKTTSSRGAATPLTDVTAVKDKPGTMAFYGTKGNFR
jgi:hypothetical protein